MTTLSGVTGAYFEAGDPITALHRLREYLRTLDVEPDSYRCSYTIEPGEFLRSGADKAVTWRARVSLSSP